MKRRSWKLWVGIGLGLLWSVYLVAANVFLRTHYFEDTVNHDPLSFRIDFEDAYSIVPGLAHVKGFRIRSHDGDIVWGATLQKAWVIVDLPALLFRRFHALTVHAEEASFALDTHQPKIPDERPGHHAGPKKPGGEPWHVQISGIDVRKLSNIHIHRYDYQGLGRLRGSFFSRPGHELQLYYSRLDLDGGAATVDGKPISAHLQGRIDTAIKDWFPDHESNAAIFDGVDSHITLAGKLEEADFLNAYLKGIRWLKILDVSGDINVDAKIRDGAFAPGTTAEVRASRMAAGLGGFRALGQGHVRWTLEKDQLVMNLKLDEYKGYAPTGGEAFMSGRDLTLQASSRDLALRKLFSDDANLDASLRIPPAKVVRLDFLNPLMPAKIFEITSGHASLEAQLNVSTTQKAEPSTFRLVSQDIEGHYNKMRFRGDVTVAAQIADAAAGTDLFEIRDASLKMSRVAVIEEKSKKEPKPWSGLVSIPKARLTPNASPVITGEAQLRFDDARPLLTMLSSSSFIARVLSKIADIKDLRGQSRFALSADYAAFSDLHITSSDLNVEGGLQLFPKTQNLLTLVNFGSIGVGIDVRGKTHHTKIIHASRWFAERPPLPPLPKARPAGSSALPAKNNSTAAAAR